MDNLFLLVQDLLGPSARETAQSLTDPFQPGQSPGSWVNTQSFLWCVGGFIIWLGRSAHRSSPISQVRAFHTDKTGCKTVGNVDRAE